MDYFGEGDIVECIQAHPRYGYVVGDRYKVQRSASGGNWDYVPCPCGCGSGFTTDGPWAVQTFKLVSPGVASIYGRAQGPGSGAVYGWDLGGPDWSEERAMPVIRCECGSDKVGTPRHSDWCPKRHDSGDGSW